ncbi:MAG: hypothetical protein HYV28_21520, partial [Ignavibacteriales bacterium]|nr:hypothetical protein [Ignavibacteriales bacterium]
EFYELSDSPKFKEFQDQVELAIGITYVRMGNFDDAMALFIRFDTTYSSSQHLGNARYVLAQMYEKDLKNFDSAIIYYQKALASAGTAEYLPLIRERSSVFNKYSTALRDYFNNRKQYVYLINPERFTQDSILFAQDTATLAADAQVVEQNSLTGQSNIQERIRDFDVDLDIERKLTELAGRTTASQGAAPVRPTISLDSSKSIMARCGVELGNMFLTSLSLPDSAYFYYSEVINEFGSRAYMAKALYGLAGYYATLNDSITADSLYRNIYANYKDDKLVNEAAKKINQPLIDFEFDPAKDTYLEAEKAFNAGNDSLALKKFEYIRENHRNSRHYAQSIYASAYILETKYKKYDSAAVIYDSLVTKFPTTAYAQKVQPKLSFYKEEKARIKQAIADSLQHIQDSLNHIQDSLKADSLAKIPKDTLVSKDSSLNKLKSPAADTTAIQGTDSTAKSGMDSTNKKLSPVITQPDEQTETPPEEKQEEIVPEKQKKPEPEKPVLVPPVVNPDNGIPPGEKGLEKPPEDERLEPKPEEGGQPTQEPPKQQLHAA